MMDKTDIKWYMRSDNAMVHTIGVFIKHHRLEQNKTQSRLAEEAGINRSTLSALEKGMHSNIITLIQVLRALNLLHVLQPFQVQQQISPIQLAEMEQAKRKRASRTTLRKAQSKKKRKSNW